MGYNPNIPQFISRWKNPLILTSIPGHTRYRRFASKERSNSIPWNIRQSSNEPTVYEGILSFLSVWWCHKKGVCWSYLRFLVKMILDKLTCLWVQGVFRVSCLDCNNIVPVFVVSRWNFQFNIAALMLPLVSCYPRDVWKNGVDVTDKKLCDVKVSFNGTI